MVIDGHRRDKSFARHAQAHGARAQARRRHVGSHQLNAPSRSGSDARAVVQRVLARREWAQVEVVVVVVSVSVALAALVVLVLVVIVVVLLAGVVVGVVIVAVDVGVHVAVEAAGPRRRCVVQARHARRSRGGNRGARVVVMYIGNETVWCLIRGITWGIGDRHHAGIIHVHVHVHVLVEL